MPVIASAPGRVNLIGEHTDYNGGDVLPLALPQRTEVQLTPREDDQVHVTSAAFSGSRSFTLGQERPGHGWIDYIQGITALVRQSKVAVPGFDLVVQSQVPVGSGLSSSAALELAVLRALREWLKLAWDDVALARLAQRVENEFVGAAVGIMDQMAASLGDSAQALYLHTRTLSFDRVPLPRDVELAVIDSGVRHHHASGDYNARKGECHAAAALLGVSYLTDLAPADLDRVARLPAPLDRRARHVVTEHHRVGEAVTAMRTGDTATLGRLFVDSHRSQRDDFAVSIPIVDSLVERALRQPGVLGARLTGGGFGGSIVVLTQAGSAHRAATAIAETASGARVLLPRPRP